MGEVRRRKSVVEWIVDGFGSRYYYEPVRTGTSTTITKREEQRKINTLRSGMEVFGDWEVIREWTETF